MISESVGMLLVLFVFGPLTAAACIGAMLWLANHGASMIVGVGVAYFLGIGLACLFAALLEAIT